jgi:putative ABC transport system permease protein
MRAGITIVSRGALLLAVRERHEPAGLRRPQLDRRRGLLPLPVARRPVSIQIGGQDFKRHRRLRAARAVFGGGSGPNDINNVIYVPYNVAHKLKPERLARDDTRHREGGADRTRRSTRSRTSLRVRRQVPFGKPNDFGMATAESIISQFRAITGGVAIAMVAISSVGLMVGGIGVMNIMLVSVTERTRR